jgi:pimeloyl-ACP methyl ester carboxylesterase
VIPSIPGYGFSAKPTAPGWNQARIGRAWDTLMKRLGYEHYVAQGGDWGAYITDVMARQAPEGLLGIHINLFFATPPDIAQALARGEPPPAGLSEEEKADYQRRMAFTATGRGYFIEQATRPQTVGFSLADSPAGLAAWMLGHDTASYELIARAFDGHPGGLTRDDVLDNITLYWLTDTGTSSARLYWESARLTAAGGVPAGVSIPVAISVFPDELYGAPRSWAERAYPNLIYLNKVDKGGHFAAWEQPELFSSELRAAFRSLR